MNDCLELAELQLQTMLCSDSSGRLTAWNKPGRPRAPWLFLLRTPQGNRWRMHAELSDALARELESLLADEPVASDFGSEPLSTPELRRALAQQVAIASEYRGPAYLLPETLGADPGVAQNGDALRVSLTLDGVEAAVCECARLGPRAAEAGVETQPAYRGRGLATRVVSTWARAVRDSGRQPLYSTWWRNAASLAVARKLGARQYGEDFHLDGE